MRYSDAYARGREKRELIVRRRKKSGTVIAMVINDIDINIENKKIFFNVQKINIKIKINIDIDIIIIITIII